MSYIDSIERLIERLGRLPGIGRRSAERIINYILSAPREEVRQLAESIYKVKESVRFCRICHNLSEQEVCSICSDVRRNQSVVCVVEKASDVNAIEKAASYSGTYHVLQGAIAPLEGRGPQDLMIDTLIARIKEKHISEVIIATDADTEGETTALYLVKLLKPLGVKLTRIGMGIPMGSNLEYADASTLSRSLEARREI